MWYTRGMKLYRGLKSEQFQLFDEAIERELHDHWQGVVERRERGDFSYREEENAAILRLEKLHRLYHQNFTDNEAIAREYAHAQGGALVTVDVPVPDILEHWKVEFQNFGKRRTKFELVYVVDGRTLARHKDRWKLHVQTDLQG